jgi:hypothetical protein
VEVLGASSRRDRRPFSRSLIGAALDGAASGRSHWRHVTRERTLGPADYIDDEDEASADNPVARLPSRKRLSAQLSSNLLTNLLATI